MNVFCINDHFEIAFISYLNERSKGQFAFTGFIPFRMLAAMGWMEPVTLLGPPRHHLLCLECTHAESGG